MPSDAAEPAEPGMPEQTAAQAPPPESTPASALAGKSAPEGLALDLHLKPLAAVEDRPPASSLPPHGEGEVLAPVKPAAALAGQSSESPAAKPQKTRQPDEPVSHVEAKPAPLAKAIPQSQATETPRETAAEPSRTEEQQPARQTALKEVAPPAAPKAGLEAREIRLEVAGADRRVELRLTERGGEVRVAVRTADSQLAGSLRENLPALSSRLAESGFRTETWHPASAAAGELHRVADTAGGSPAGDASPDSQQHGNGRQSDAESRHPRPPEEQFQRKEKGKDFAWLMSSLQ